MIKFDREICSDFENATSREWLETNGIGGYASSTVSGAHTRRYHGLLVASTRPPLGRMVLLSKFEETLMLDGKSFELSSNQYPGTVHPTGFQYLKSFRLDPFPIWTFEVDRVELQKTVFMVHGENSTVCEWKINRQSESSDLKFEIELKPLFAFRDHHHLRHEDASFDAGYREDENLVSIAPYTDVPRLYLSHNGAGVVAQGHWYHNFEYAIERERGFDFTESLFQPFSLRFDLSEPAAVIASTEARDISQVAELREREMARRREIVEVSGADDDFTRQLALAADQFIVARGTGKTVIAGYHWFSDWGRDTMIALPGLTLATNRPDIAKSILVEFSRHISEGMLPNRFPDAGEVPEYNTVDATLWYFEAVRAYAEATGDYGLVRDELYDKLVNIIDWHFRGTRYQIRVDTDSLLHAGEPGVQLTWMDAKVGDWVVTPRTGKPVEIQALWYNALRIMAGLAERFSDVDRQKKYSSAASMALDSFNGQFWNETQDSLFDVVDGDERDASIRPNQIFAVSLRHTMLDAERARKVVDKVEADLLTPYGLRSLSPADPHYAPIYIGSPLERDGSYHQGTVWGWLIGPFVEAYLKTRQPGETGDGRVSEILAAFRTHLSEAMVGQISEIFDADPPHHPRGAAAQAWSVAELLRISIVLQGAARGETH